MEQALEVLIGKLLEHGPWGFLVIWLMYTNWRLNNRLDASDVATTKMLERHAEQREKSAEVMMTASNAMAKISDAVKILSDQIEGMSDKIVTSTNVGTQLGERINSLQQTLNTDITNRGNRRA